MNRDRARRLSADAVQRHVELLRRGAAAISENDVDALVPLVSDDFELHPGIAAAFVGATVYHGKDGVRRYMADIKEAFDDLSFEPLSFSTWGDYLICPIRVFGHGTASGADVDFEITGIWKVIGGLIVWGGTYLHRADGLEAIGASEDEIELIE